MVRRTCERRRGGSGTATGGSRGGALALVAVGTVLSTAAAWSALLGAAASSASTHSTIPIYIAGGTIVLLACLVVVVHATRTAHRIAGPEYRLVQSLRRLRQGDLSFRIGLRRGDLLAGLADECNQVIEWLNQNPPSGSRTGTDLVEVEEAVDDGEPVLVAAEVRP